MIENDFTKKKNFFNNFGNLLYIETEKILNFPLLISYPFSSQSYWINNMSKKHRRRRRDAVIKCMGYKKKKPLSIYSFLLWFR